MKAEKYIKIELIPIEGEGDNVNFHSKGISTFEAIGLLTYFRDKLEMHQMKSEEPIVSPNQPQ